MIMPERVSVPRAPLAPHHPIPPDVPQFIASKNSSTITLLYDVEVAFSSLRTSSCASCLLPSSSMLTSHPSCSCWPALTGPANGVFESRPRLKSDSMTSSPPTRSKYEGATPDPLPVSGHHGETDSLPNLKPATSKSTIDHQAVMTVPQKHLQCHRLLLNSRHAGSKSRRQALKIHVSVPHRKPMLFGGYAPLRRSRRSALILHARGVSQMRHSPPAWPPTLDFAATGAPASQALESLLGAFLESARSASY